MELTRCTSSHCLLGTGITGTGIAAPGATPGGDLVVVPGGTGIGVPGGTGLPVAPSGKPGKTNRLNPPNTWKAPSMSCLI